MRTQRGEPSTSQEEKPQKKGVPNTVLGLAAPPNSEKIDVSLLAVYSVVFCYDTVVYKQRCNPYTKGLTI